MLDDEIKLKWAKTMEDLCNPSYVSKLNPNRKVVETLLPPPVYDDDISVVQRTE